jgi:hypothetical protein
MIEQENAAMTKTVTRPMRTLFTAATCGVLAGLAIVAAAKIVLLDPFLAAQAAAEERRVRAENLRRDEMVAEHIVKLDGEMKLMACWGYIGGLTEQKLSISPIIRHACSAR